MGKENAKIPHRSELTTITSICPTVTTIKNNMEVDNRLQLTELLNQTDSCYIKLPSDVNLNFYDYCWLLGSSYSREKTKDYFDQDLKYFFPDSHFCDRYGYVNTVPYTWSELNFYRIDPSCYRIENDGVSINKVYFNNPTAVFMDNIRGGILTNLDLVPDFYYYLENPVLIDFKDIYVFEEDTRRKYQVLLEDERKFFLNQTANEQRISIIKYAIKEKILTDVNYDNEQTIPTYLKTKQDLFDFLMTSEKITTEFQGKNKFLFSTLPDTFFKNNKDIKQVLKIKSGRRSPNH